MGLRNKIYQLIPILTYITRNNKLKNRFSFIIQILFSKECHIKFNNNINFVIESYDYPTILHVLSLERYSQIFRSDDDKIIISFDRINQFYISSKKLTREDKVLLDLLDFGVKEGAIFIDKEHSVPFKNDKIIKIIQEKRSIVETSEGVRFYLDISGAIVEAFIRRIHDQYSNDLSNKVVIDIGASVGDTPLYFASKGATVYAFEMTKTNFDGMLENLKLNPELSKKIFPVNCAVGKDEEVTYTQDSRDLFSADGGASFVTNKYGQNSKEQKVQGMTIKTILKKYNISNIELLKLDCKGCEFFLTKEDLQIVKRLKIEYYSHFKSHSIQSIVELLRNLNFKVVFFKHNTLDITEFERHGNLYAERDK
jgi:FkbM family methyltransferase